MSVNEIALLSTHTFIRTRIVLPRKLLSTYRLDGQTFRVASLEGLLRILLDI